MSRALRWIATQALLLAVLLLAAQTFLAVGWLRPLAVVGESMTPTLVEGRRVLVRRGATPRRGDLIVVRSPDDARRLAVKRVVGLPGERITLRDGRVWADGRPTRNPAGDAGVYYGAHGNPVWTVGGDEWFVAGDNQTASVDSRHWGPIPSRLVVGIVATPTH